MLKNVTDTPTARTTAVWTPEQTRVIVDCAMELRRLKLSGHVFRKGEQAAFLARYSRVINSGRIGPVHYANAGGRTDPNGFARLDAKLRNISDVLVSLGAEPIPGFTPASNRAQIRKAGDPLAQFLVEQVRAALELESLRAAGSL